MSTDPSSRILPAVAAYIGTRIGKKYHVKPDQGVGDAVQTGVGDYFKA